VTGNRSATTVSWWSWSCLLPAVRSNSHDDVPLEGINDALRVLGGADDRVRRGRPQES
jgi:hypothetical protein